MLVCSLASAAVPTTGAIDADSEASKEASSTAPIGMLLLLLLVVLLLFLELGRPSGDVNKDGA